MMLSDPPPFAICGPRRPLTGSASIIPSKKWNKRVRPAIDYCVNTNQSRKHMSNPDQGGQQSQGGQKDQKPGQQQQKPGQGGQQQGDQKPGQQEQQK